MKSPLRLVGRIAFLLLVLVLLAIGGVLAWFTSWRADRLADLDADSEIVATSLGPVEVSIRGDGPPVLVLHDAPGGYDQARVFAAGLEEAGFRVIAPSRPGYLRTPLNSGLLPQQQGDLMVALLDALQVDRVGVLAVGSAGPSAIEMSLRFPSRVSGLVLLSAVSRKIKSSLNPGETSQSGALIDQGLTGDVGSWIMVDFSESRPATALGALVDWTTIGSAYERSEVVNAIIADPSRLEWSQALIATFAPLSPRETGVRNDIMNDLALGEMPLAKLTVPVLIIHGTKDRNVPFADAELAGKTIPGAKFLPVEGGGHFVFLSPGAEGMRSQIAAFLQGGGN